MAIIKRRSKSKCWWECGEKGTLVYCWWDVNCYSHHGNQYGVASKATSATTMWSNNSASGCLYKEDKMLIWRDICTPLISIRSLKSSGFFFVFSKQERSEDSFSGKSLWTKSLISQLRCFQCEKATEYLFIHQVYSNPKERQCQRMLKLPHSYTHFTC